MFITGIAHPLDRLAVVRDVRALWEHVQTIMRADSSDRVSRLLIF